MTMTAEEMVAVKIACQGRERITLAELNLAEDITKAIREAINEAYERAGEECDRLWDARNEHTLNNYEQGFMDGIDVCRRNVRSLKDQG